MNSKATVTIMLVSIVVCAGLCTGAEPWKHEPIPWQPRAYRAPFTEAERAKPYVHADSHTLEDFPFLDGQWEGIIGDSEGNVWFAVSSHSDYHHGQIFKYDLKADKVHHVADLGQVCGEKLTVDRATQDKVHSRMFEDGDVIYCGTCEGHVIDNRPYKGGYWLKIHKKTGIVENLGMSVTKDGLICVEYDPYHKLLYGHTNRYGRLTVFDPATRQEKDLGVPWSDVKRDWPRGLTLMITKDGTVYGVKPPHCTFWQYDPKTGKISNVEVDMPLPDEVVAARKADPSDKDAQKVLKDWDGSAVHMTLWDETDQCFYVMRSFDEMLMRFYPPKDGKAARAEAVRKFGLPIRRYGNRYASCTLVMMGRTLYYTPYTGWGGIAHLQSYDLEKQKFTDHGPIIVEQDQRVNECHSLAAGKDGRLYLVAFVFNREGKERVRDYSMRDGYPFHPRFVIIDPKKHCKVP